MLRIIFHFLAILMFTTCNISDKNKLERILNSEDLYIQENIYGGYSGYSELKFHLKKGEFETLVIIDEGTDYQTFVRITDEKKELLKQFIKEAYRTNKPDREMSMSCMTGIDSEFILKKGYLSLTLRPDRKISKMFNKIIYTETYISEEESE